MLLPKQAKRLAIFAYYDAEGLVDDYVPYMLEQVGKFCTTQIVVVNGILTPMAQEKLAPFADEIVFRENAGYDVTAYKEGVLRQRAHWEEYDEILFYNQTIFGPVCPLDAMFDEMAARDVDFWGLTRHKGAPHATWDENVPIPPHVQSFFFAVRRSLVCTDAFAQYWETLPPIETYWDAVGKHEIVFTEHFAAQGFRWDVYVHTEDLEVYNDYPLMGMPTLLLKERGCPFFKRKSFTVSALRYAAVPQGQAVQQLYDYLRTQTQYPLSLPIQNILRTEAAATIAQAIALCYQPSDYVPSAASLAAVLYVAADSMAEMLCEAAQRLCGGARFFVVFANDALRQKWESRFPSDADVRVCKERGPVVLFGELWDAVRTSTYVLYLTNDMPVLLEQFYDVTNLQCAIDGLASKQAVSVLEQDPLLGVLLPVTVSHKEALTMNHLHLEHTEEQLQNAMQALALPMPQGDGTSGVASRGGVFLARTAAVAPLAGRRLSPALFEDDAPIWECIPALAAQKSGYLTAVSGTFAAAASEMMYKGEMLRNVEQMWATPNRKRYDEIEFRMQCILQFYYERRFQMTLEQAFQAKLPFKQKMWICLQIWLKPATFAKLHRLLGGGSSPQRPPADTLE